MVMKPWKDKRIPISMPLIKQSRRPFWTQSRLWIALACFVVLNAALGGPPSLVRHASGAVQIQMGAEALPLPTVGTAEFNAMDSSMTGGISIVAAAMDAAPCSSCAIQAAVSAAETAVAITLGLDVSRVDLSEQDLQYCSPVKEHSCGEDVKLQWQLKDALKQLFFWQALQGKCLPLPDKATVKKLTQNSASLCIARPCAETNTLVTAGDFSVKGLNTKWQIQQQIRVFGTAPAVMEMYSDFDPFFSKPANRKAVYLRASASRAIGARDVLLVGYSVREQYWLARDCKGTSWADNGVVKVAFSSANFRAVFGVSWQPKSDMIEVPAATAAGTAGSKPSLQPPDRQLQALYMIKSDLDPIGMALTDWTAVNSGSTTEERVYCRWRGIFCNGQQQIVQVNLATLFDGLSGTLPAAWVLQQLPQLTHFLVGPSKSLHGELPSDWSELNQLEEIAVVGTAVSGAIPSSWGGLKSLKRLRLWQNRLGWQVPASLGRLPLQELQLTGNKLNGTLPAEWGALSSLTDLRLADNDFAGTIPTQWSGMKSLKELHLELNEGLTGCLLPEWQAFMTKSMYAATGLSGFCSKGNGGSKPSN